MKHTAILGLEKKINQPILESSLEEMGNNLIGDNLYVVDNNNNIIGLYLNEIADDASALIESWVSMKCLFLINSRITHVQFLKKMENIEQVSIENSVRRTIDLSSLYNKENLTFLSLNNISLKLPYNLSLYLKFLKTLSLVNCEIKDIEFLYNFVNLEEVYLQNNKIKDITMIARFKELLHLDLSNNQIEDVKPLRSLKMLSSLKLSQNNISFFEEDILYNLPNLKILALHGNPISNIPPSIFDYSISIKNAPRNIGFDNIATYFPDAKNDIPYFIFRNSRTNQLIVYLSCLNKLKNYFEQIKEQGTTKVYEVKMILVGEAGTGKTTLRKKLIDRNYEVPNAEDKKNSTHAIEITPQVKFLSTPHPLFANIWDFGGQHNYYSTHRYFLTEWAMYVLVADERKENTRYDYWFHIIDLLAKDEKQPKQPVLVVYNKNSGNFMKTLDINSFQEKYPYLEIDEIVLDFSEKYWGESELRKKLTDAMKKLNHVGMEIPAYWGAIRSDLEQLRTKQKIDKIDLGHFFEICKKNKLDKTEDQLELSRFLHRMGIILHYQDGEDILANTVILNPNWAIDAVYAALHDRQKIQKGGFRFKKNDMTRYWQSKGYQLIDSNAFLNLMLRDRFEIAYLKNDNNGTTWVIAPELLPVQPAKYSFTNKDVLVLRYQYQFMPEGVLTHFIVRMSEYIVEQNEEQMVWKNGVFLNNKNEALAEVKRLELEGNREIRFQITVVGKNKESFLREICQNFESINDRFQSRLKVIKLVPCCCKKCKNSDNPKYIELEDLQRFKNAKIVEDRCRQSLEIFNVMDILKYYDFETTKEIWEIEKHRLTTANEHLDVEKNKLLSVLPTKKHLIDSTIYVDIEDDIQNFSNKKYFKAAKSLYSNIENIMNNLLEKAGENPLSFGGIGNKNDKLKKLTIISKDLHHSINSADRNMLLHGNYAPAEDSLCKPLAQSCMLILSELMKKL